MPKNLATLTLRRSIASPIFVAIAPGNNPFNLVPIDFMFLIASNSQPRIPANAATTPTIPNVIPLIVLSNRAPKTIRLSNIPLPGRSGSLIS